MASPGSYHGSGYPPPPAYPEQGYTQGYPQQGYPPQGLPQSAYAQQVYPQQQQYFPQAPGYPPTQPYGYATPQNTPRAPDGLTSLYRKVKKTTLKILNGLPQQSYNHQHQRYYDQQQQQQLPAQQGYYDEQQQPPMQQELLPEDVLTPQQLQSLQLARMQRQMQLVQMQSQLTMQSGFAICNAAPGDSYWVTKDV